MEDAFRQVILAQTSCSTATCAAVGSHILAEVEALCDDVTTSGRARVEAATLSDCGT
jgi:ABC-type Na+ transport system ATPase subunit NatA